jgi:hypothetical protein
MISPSVAAVLLLGVITLMVVWVMADAFRRDPRQEDE